VYTNYRYTPRELSILASQDSFDYLPGHSTVYQQWLQRQPARLDWDRWVVMALIGITVGLLGFLLQQIIHLISHVKWQRAQQLIQVNGRLACLASTLRGNDDDDMMMIVMTTVRYPKSLILLF